MLHPIVYASGSTARFVEQAIIDMDPNDEMLPLPLKCDASFDIFGSFSHYYCNPLTCIEAAIEAFNESLMYDMWYDDEYYYN
jgi:hypothetical protein